MHFETVQPQNESTAPVRLDQASARIGKTSESYYAVKIKWMVADSDVHVVRKLMSSAENSNFVLHRQTKNVSGPGPQFSRESIWRVMAGCLLTTQQRSGPDSPIQKLVHTTPFPLEIKALEGMDIAATVESTISRFKGIRRGPTIGKALQRNWDWLNPEGWIAMESQFLSLQSQRSEEPEPSDRQLERKAAALMSQHLQGFGPKQSRNFWQWLGLTRYEIPLDSRVLKWLNTHVLSAQLSASNLSDESYYRVVMDGVQTLCSEADTLPCLFDAAVFSQFDREWTVDELEF